MIDIKRLHQIHFKHPSSINRREEKSTYCFDNLLRCSQTGYYKNLAYITNTYKASKYSLNDFMEYLQLEDEKFTVDYNGVIELNNTKITFKGVGREVSNIRFDGFIEDYF